MLSGGQKDKTRYVKMTKTCCALDHTNTFSPDIKICKWELEAMVDKKKVGIARVFVIIMHYLPPTARPNLRTARRRQIDITEDLVAFRCLKRLLLS